MRAFSLTCVRSIFSLLVVFSVTTPNELHAAPDLAISSNHFGADKSQVFTMSGDAALDGSRIRLTRAEGALAGSAMYSDVVELARDKSFSTYFTFSMSPLGDPATQHADGIAFILHNDEKNVGINGEGIGYKGIEPSFVVEFDTFHNGFYGDPDANHIGINLNGDMKSIATVTAPMALSDGAVRHVWIEYDGSTKIVEVRVATTSSRPSKATLSHKIDISGLFGDSPHVGFTAGTGSYNQEHHIESFYFVGSYLRDGIDPPRE